MKTFTKWSMMALFTVLACLTLFSCKPAEERAFEQFKSICEEISTNGLSCSNEEWNAYELKFDEALSELGKYEYTSEQSKEIGRLKTLVVEVAVTRGAEQFVDDINAMWNEAQGIWDAIKEGVGL